ncbi:MAG: hypothetical protein BBJ60_09515 [Desulfobacterales bacterium S7086C20]|nr:MAG: hypothetical protein BBJ60_09515 [Desulfobacterales bacterium S7086C20]
MRLKTLKAKLYLTIIALVGIIALLFAYSYFNTLVNEADDQQHKIMESEKDFSRLVFSERAALEKREHFTKLIKGYEELRQSCTSCHSKCDKSLLNARVAVLDQLFKANVELLKFREKVHGSLTSLVNSVRYIHEHHIAYSKNILKKGHTAFEDYADHQNFKKSPIKSASDEDIIKIAVAIQYDLADILGNFYDLNAGGNALEVKKRFDDNIKKFFSNVNTFEDYSLDAQDGLLVEELLTKGGVLENSFSTLINLKNSKKRLINESEKNREDIFGVLRSVNSAIESKVNRISNNLKHFQIIALLLATLLIGWMVLSGGKIIRETGKIIKETERIKNDFSYQIDIDSKSSGELVILSKALNTMAGKINYHIQNLEAMVHERTSELHEMNERLQSEVSDRKQAEEELQKARDELEQRVEVRTFKLLEVNDSLKLEIEERKRVEGALRSSEEKYRSTFEGTPDSITITEMTTGQYMEVNDGFCQMTGYSREEVLGKSPFALNIFWNPADREGFINILREEGEVNGFELKYRMKDGTVIDTLFSARPILYGGKDCLVTVVKDITPLKRAEEEKNKLQAQLQHYQRMESIGTIASGMAHNFRNILAGISVNSQLLQMRHKDDQGITDVAESINSSVARGSRLIQGLMQFSRKQGTEALEPLNLVDVIREVDNLISKSFDKRIDIIIDVPEALYVVGDQVGLSQILMNLCTNARDAMPEGGMLEIEAKQVRDKAVIIVSDSGHGMDRETQEKCFYPFFTTKDVGKGTGLGLSTTYGLIREHNGDVHVYSEQEKGTTFKLYFPLALSEKRGPGEPMSLPVQGAGQKILIVDDEEEITSPLKEMLKGLGYRASAVDNGIAAIDKYRAWRPDAVLLDRSMPQMDGIICAEKILELDTNARIILISGYEEKGVNGIDGKTKSRIKGYFTKPVNLVELSQLLANLFG